MVGRDRADQEVGETEPVACVHRAVEPAFDPRPGRGVREKRRKCGQRAPKLRSSASRSSGEELDPHGDRKPDLFDVEKLPEVTRLVSERLPAGSATACVEAMKR